jgi:hypothetical protein
MRDHRLEMLESDNLTEEVPDDVGDDAYDLAADLAAGGGAGGCIFLGGGGVVFSLYVAEAVCTVVVHASGRESPLLRDCVLCVHLCSLVV